VLWDRARKRGEMLGDEKSDEGNLGRQPFLGNGNGNPPISAT